MNNKLRIFLRVFLLFVIVALFVAVAIPNFVKGGPSKLTNIINMLKLIDGAKEEWAERHGFTNTNNVRLLHEMSLQDIAPLLAWDRGHVDRFGFGFDTNGYICSPKDVLLEINPLGVSPRAIFLREYKEAPGPLPEGAVIQLDQNKMEEYILPGHPPKIYRWLNQQFMQVNRE